MRIDSAQEIHTLTDVLDFQNAARLHGAGEAFTEDAPEL